MSKSPKSESISEVLIGRMKLQWWRDVVTAI